MKMKKNALASYFMDSIHAYVRTHMSPLSMVRPYSTVASATKSPKQTTWEATTSDGEGKYANIDWDNVGFQPTQTDYMYVMKGSKEENFSQGNLTPYGNIELTPFSGILNYGQGLFEGLKACRAEDGRVLLFRPHQNGLRMMMGAERLCLASPSAEQFVDAIKQTVSANKRWVPPPGKGVLYIRPLLIGSGPVLDLGPAPECTFLVYTSPIGNYHKVRAPMNLVVEEKLHRSTPGGTGGVKSITNYAPVFKTLTQARTNGFSEVLYLDSLTGKYVEEISTCNVFIVKGNVISTPAARGTVLPGITRKSVIEIAEHFGYQVEERDVPVEELIDADEVFCTANVLAVFPVRTITYKSKKIEYKTGEETVTRKLFTTLTGIQTGLIEDKMGWTVVVD